MDKNYKGVIWTNHALARMEKRGIKQGDAWATFRRPDNSRFAESKGAWVYYKTYGDVRIEVVAKKNAKKAFGPKGHRPGEEWIVVSVWSKNI